uniref:Uncharacterized protein n=1 Tax=Amphora coffeiformis TaxID=265554 RepID=A0A7S3L8I1_9STRA
MSTADHHRLAEGMEILRLRLEAKRNNKNNPLSIKALLYQHKQRQRLKKGQSYQFCGNNDDSADTTVLQQQQEPTKTKVATPTRGKGKASSKAATTPTRGQSKLKKQQQPNEENQTTDDQGAFKVTVVTASNPESSPNRSSVTSDKGRSGNTITAVSQTENNSVVDSSQPPDIVARQQMAILESLLEQRERDLRKHYEQALQECEEKWQGKYQLALDDAQAILAKTETLLEDANTKWEATQKKLLSLQQQREQRNNNKGHQNASWMFFQYYIGRCGEALWHGMSDNYRAADCNIPFDRKQRPSGRNVRFEDDGGDSSTLDDTYDTFDSSYDSTLEEDGFAAYPYDHPLDTYKWNLYPRSYLRNVGPKKR